MKNNSELISKAQTRMVLRLVLVVYMAFLGIKIFKAEDTSMNTTLAHIIGVFFIGVAVLFCIYTFVRMKKDISSAKQKEEVSSDEQHELNGE